MVCHDEDLTIVILFEWLEDDSKKEDIGKGVCIDDLNKDRIQTQKVQL